MVLVEVSESVVDLTMLGLVSSNVLNQLSHSRVGAHVPVVNGNFGDLDVVALPLGKSAGVNIGDATGVGDNGLLLKVADKSVADSRRHEVGHEEEVEEDTLSEKDHGSHEISRLVHLEEGQKMHSLVVGLLKESLNPSSVSLKSSQRLEMSAHSANHTGDTGNGLQEEESLVPLFGGHLESLEVLLSGLGMLVASEQIKRPSHGSNGGQSTLVGKGLCVSVLDHQVLHLGLGVDGMDPHGGSLVLVRVVSSIDGSIGLLGVGQSLGVSRLLDHVLLIRASGHETKLGPRDDRHLGESPRGSQKGGCSH